MATRDDEKRRRTIIRNPGLHPDERWLLQYYETYLRRAPSTSIGLPTTSTTSTTSSTSSTSSTTTA